MSKVWLITGSGNGLGRDIAEAALAAGDSVVAGARRTPIGVKSCILTCRIFRRSSPNRQRESAVLLFQLGGIIRDYPPSPAEGLTSHERLVALALFKSASAPPAPPSSRRAVLRYFFCANSLAASAAREKSKIDPTATSPFKLAVELSIAM
jgi:hypothetical protein